MMVQKPYLNRRLLILALAALSVKAASFSPWLIENYYANGLYPPIALFLRTLFGRLPFSFGDVLYAAAAIFLCVILAKSIKKWRAGYRRQLLLRAGHWLLHAALVVYLVFQLLWGLNYSRQGIGKQLALTPTAYTPQELDSLAIRVEARLRETGQRLTASGRHALLKQQALNNAGLEAYKAAARQYSFLQYRVSSIKPSLFSGVGHLVGFTGYYNPFTAEAQIKTDIPIFLQPFVVTHEMAHQLGYARESEANFVAFLTCRASANNDVRYAVYFEMFVYTLSQMRQTDSVAALRYRNRATQQVKADLQTLINYLERSRNPVEPYISRLYDAYLRWNNQPKGRQSYNEVVAWVIAYGKKYGWENI
jgi:hypothetical protein